MCQTHQTSFKCREVVVFTQESQLEAASLPVTLYKFLRRSVPISEMQAEMTFHYFTHPFMASDVCRIVAQLVCNYDYLYF